MEAEFLEVMPATVIIEPFVGNDEYTEPSYGPGYPCRARVEATNHEYPMPAGQVAVLTAMVYLFNPERDGVPIVPGQKDRFTLPDGERPHTLAVVREADENGDYFNIAYLAARAPVG